MTTEVFVSNQFPKLLWKKVLTTPEDHVRSDTILSVVHEDNLCVGIHRLSGEELVVLEVGDDPAKRGKGKMKVFGNGRGAGRA